MLVTRKNSLTSNMVIEKNCVAPFFWNEKSIHVETSAWYLYKTGVTSSGTSHVEFFESYEFTETSKSKKTDTKISNLEKPIQKTRKKFLFHFTKSFIPITDLWKKNTQYPTGK